ncbi:MAG: hypothetical protein HY721_20520, partial [Planctomycetes bacterium]|nr:hypothetical protein [Planctomycetota bacterium]
MRTVPLPAAGARGAGRRAVALLLLPFLAAIIPSAALEAANGDVLSVSNVLSGKELTGIALDSAGPPAGGSFWVSTKVTGKLHHVSLDLTTALGEIDNPHGVGTFIKPVLTWGVAYRPLTRTIFVLAQDGPAWKVKEVRPADGAEVVEGAFTVVPPDPATATLRGLAYDSIQRALWCIDSNNDKVIQMDFAGQPTKVCPLPGDVPPETTIRGDGISFELFEVAPNVYEPRLYVTYGDIFRRDPSRLVQLTDQCVPTGIEVPLGKVPGTPFAVQTYRLGTQQRRVAVTTLEGKIGQVEQVVPQPVPPSGLTCALTLSNKVSLSWANHGTGPDGAYQGEIQVLRNDVPFATVPGSTRELLDDTPLEGTSTYSLRAADAPSGPMSPLSFPCDATVGTGGMVRWIPFGGIAPFDVARDPATGEVFATDNIGAGGRGRILRYDARLDYLGEVPSPWDRPGPIAFVPRITIQGQVLTDLLAVGRTDGTLVKLMDVAGNEKTTFGLDGATAGQIGSLTYIPSTEEFAYLRLSDRAIVITNNNGRVLSGRGACKPPDFLNLPGMEAGLTYDPIQDTFLVVFEDGVVRELYNGGNCVPTNPPFEISLQSLGEGFAALGFTAGMEIAANTLVICGRDSLALFQVLIFPAGPPFRRGDFDRNGAVDITDAVASAGYLFRSGRAPTCQDAADGNDDGVLDVSDPIYLL